MKKFLLTALLAVGLLTPANEALALTTFNPEDLTTIKVGNDDLYFTLDNENKVATLQHYRVKQGRYDVDKYYEFTSFTIPTTVTFEGETYTVALGDGALTSSPNLKTLVVPEQFSSLPDEFASRCNQLTELSLPDNLVSLGNSTFAGCSSLANVNLPANFKRLGNSTFQSCTALESIVLPEGMESLSGPICLDIRDFRENSTFAYSGLKSIVIPASIDTIPNYCFDSCDNLERVVIKEGVKVIGAASFRGIGMSAKPEDRKPIVISIPESVTEIHFRAFYANVNLHELNLPQGLTLLGSRAFRTSGLRSLTVPSLISVLSTGLIMNTEVKELTVPTNITNVYPQAMNTSSLEKLTISDSEQTIYFNFRPEGGALNDALGYMGQWLSAKNVITDLYLGRNIAVTDIPAPAAVVSREGEEEDPSLYQPFWNMNSLKNITIGENVTDATSLVLDRYSALESITINANVPPTINMPTASQMATVKIIVPEDAIEAYKADAQWGTFTNIEEVASITEIEADNNAPTVYYNLQGQRVDNPANGVFIRQQGAKTEKVRL